MGCGASNSNVQEEDPFFTKEELDLLKKVFQKLDKDSSGTLDRKEIKKFCKKIGNRMGKKNVDADLEKYGQEGTLAFQEFLDYLESEYLADCQWEHELTETLQNIYDTICKGEWDKEH